MPPSASALGKRQNKVGAKVKAVDGESSRKKTKLALNSDQKVRKQPLKHPEKKRAKQSKDATRKLPASSISGKAAEIVSPLVLNYWNGRGLMEVPRMMLGEQSCARHD